MAIRKAVVPQSQVPLKRGQISNLGHFTGRFHGSIPGQLRLRMRPGLFGGVPAGQGIVGCNISRNLGSNDQADIAFAQVGQADGRFGAVRFVVHTFFPGIDRHDGLPQVAVPFHGIHAKVEVCVYQEHIALLSTSYFFIPCQCAPFPRNLLIFYGISPFIQRYGWANMKGNPV